MVFFAMLGVLFLLTQHLQFVLGYTPLQAGSRLLPVATVMIAAPLSARLVDRVGTKAVVVSGMLLSAFALWLLTTAGAGSGYAPAAAALALIGVGQGLAGPPATTSIMGSLPLANAGVGAGINTTIRQVGSALGVAVLGSVLASGYTSAITPRSRAFPPRSRPRHATPSGRRPRSPPGWDPRGSRCWSQRGRPLWMGWAWRCWSGSAS
jgi:MFS family permease